MIIGYDLFFGQDNSSVFDTVVSLGNINSGILKNGKFDEISFDEDISKVYNNTKEEWDYQFVLDAKFQGNLEAGNIDNKGLQIQQVKFQKRLTDSLIWTDVGILDYSTLQTVYTFIDKYVKNNFEYDFCVVPLTSGVTGKRTTASITPEFQGVFLCDKDTQFQLFYNMEIGAFEHVNPSTILEPLNSKHPIVQYSVLDYQKGNIKALVLSADTIALNGDSINIRSEKINRDALMKWLKNHKPKIYKASNGDFMIISVVDNPTVTPNNDFEGAIADVSFNFVEIDDVERNGALTENGLVVL